MISGFNEPNLTSPLIASTSGGSLPDSSATAHTYNSTEFSGLQTKGTESSVLDYDGSLSADGGDAVATESSPSLDVMAPRTTAGQAFIHLLKGYIGPGCLSLPWAVSQVGFLGGAIAIAIMSFWSSYNCWTIVKIKRYIERANMENFRVNETDETKSAKSETASSVASSALTYPDVGEWAYGDNFQQFLALCICTQQLAICTVFFSFIGENIYAVCELVPEAVPSIFTSHIGVMTVALPFIMGLSFIPSLDALTPVMVAGTLLLFSGFGVVGYVISLVWEDRPTDPVDIQWKSAPLALCAILYSYEGICLILPIESSMAEPKKFKMVFWSAMFCIALILATVSMVCVYAFGEVTNGSVTAFLLEEYKGNTSVIVFLMVANTAVSLSVLFTYPIQLFPTLEILGPKFTKCWWKVTHSGDSEFDGKEDDEDNDLTGFDPMPPLPEHDVASLSSFNQEHIYDKHDEGNASPCDKGEDEQQRKIALDTRGSFMSNITEVFPKMTIPGDSLLLRVCLVILTYTVAVIVPNVQALISLAGAVAGSSSALLIPPMLELALIEHLETQPDVTKSPKISNPSFRQSMSAQNPSLLMSLWRHDLSGKYWKMKLKCYCSFWIGFIFFLIGAYASIADILSIWTSKD
mmetsp:Transcript_15342/g.33147  ORF Transcript_15342/g.33147 Transcript_15342/m.33147 type:complete len:635 (+) Transcript_15342:82-1986(+)